MTLRGGKMQGRLRGQIAVVFAALAAGWPGGALAQVDGIDGACRVVVTGGSATRCDGCFTNVRMTVRAGGVCRLQLVPGEGRIMGFSWPVAPKHGQIGVANESAAAYQAGAQSGEDYFEGRIRFERRRRFGEPAGRDYVAEHLVRARVTIRAGR